MIDEAPHPGELARAYALRLASAKAEDVRTRDEMRARSGPMLVLAADTVVACGRRILPQALSEEEARACLALLSGRRHRVTTALALADSSGVRATRAITTQVAFKRLGARDVARYLASREWHGKAGGYAIQGLAAAFIPWINGSYTAVVGLPLAETAGLLIAHGLEPGLVPVGASSLDATLKP